jgi:hypothetical protein
MDGGDTVTIETMAKKPEFTPASEVVDQRVVAELLARASADDAGPCDGKPL